MYFLNLSIKEEVRWSRWLNQWIDHFMKGNWCKARSSVINQSWKRAWDLIHTTKVAAGISGWVLATTLGTVCTFSRRVGRSTSILTLNLITRTWCLTRQLQILLPCWRIIRRRCLRVAITSNSSRMTTLVGLKTRNAWCLPNLPLETTLRRVWKIEFVVLTCEDNKLIEEVTLLLLKIHLGQSKTARTQFLSPSSMKWRKQRLRTMIASKKDCLMAMRSSFHHHRAPCCPKSRSPSSTRNQERRNWEVTGPWIKAVAMSLLLEMPRESVSWQPMAQSPRRI